MVNAMLAKIRSTISPMKTESNWEGTLRRARLILGRHSLWRAGLGRPSKYGIAFAFLLAIPQFALAADKKEANVTEAVRDVRLLFGQMVISPPNPTKPPRVCNVALSQVLNGRLVKGFKHKLPESALISADIEKQKRAASEASTQ